MALHDNLNAEIRLVALLTLGLFGCPQQKSTPPSQPVAMEQPAQVGDASRPSSNPAAPKRPLASDKWTQAQLAAVMVDVPSFSKRLDQQWQNGVGAGVHAVYTATDGMQVRVVGAWERDFTAPTLEESEPHGVDITTKQKVKCTYEGSGDTRTLSCSAYGMYWWSKQWNVDDAMFTVSVDKASNSTVKPSKAKDYVELVGGFVLRASTSAPGR